MVLPNNKALETIYVSGLRILNDQPQQASLQQAFWNSFSLPFHLPLPQSLLTALLNLFHSSYG